MHQTNQPFRNRPLFLLIILSQLVTFGFSVSGQKVRLRAKITPTCTEVRSQAGVGIKYSDLYGDGNIAVQGSYNCNGVFIFDISNPDAPVLASWYNPGNNQQFLEAIVIGNRGYFGSGIGSGGVHIVDLTNPYSPVLLGTVDATHPAAPQTPGHPVIHEMLVFDQAGSRYLIENYNSTGTKSLRVFNITDPANPVFKYEFLPTGAGWVHNMHIRGNWMFTSQYSGTQLEVYDISNLATQAPTFRTAITSNSTNHSSWTSEDGNYLYSARETFDGDLRVYDIRPLFQNPPQPALLIRSIKAGDLGINAITPHNPVVMGNKLYVAWYQAGIQVFDISNAANPVRIGQYDTFPAQFAPTIEEVRKLESADPWDMICGDGRLLNSSLPSNYDGAWAVFPFLGEDKVLSGDVRSGLLVLDVSRATAPVKNGVSDFDGDGKTDFSVFRPAIGDWQIETSSTGTQNTTHFGQNSDVIVPGDYDGDGKSDLAVFRPSTGVWYMQRSTSGFASLQFGSNGDIPVAADYDADGKTDVAVWRPSTGVWYILQSTLGMRSLSWGSPTDKPVTGDFEGDGKTDVSVWRPSTGTWYVLQSSSSIPMFVYWGTNGDKPVSADFDGNGISDFAVYRPSTGIWYIIDPVTGAFQGFSWGISEDMPIPADYDGDAKADVTVFRPSTREWYRLNSSNGAINVRLFGESGDRPSPSSVQPQ